MAALHAYAADKRPRMRFTIARAALATSVCLAADLPVQPIGHQDGSLLLQLGPPVGFHNETLSITATIRGARATRTRRMTTGVPVHFRFSNHEDSLVLLVCARDAHGRLDEPIAILEQARNTVPTPAPHSARSASASPNARYDTAVCPRPNTTRCPFAAAAANAAPQWVSKPCGGLVTRSALDVDIASPVRRPSAVRRGAWARVRQRVGRDASLRG